jgi:hypothetical protein
MDVRQRADDALEAVTDLRDGALADLRHEMESSGHKSLGTVDAFVKDALAGLEDELRKLTGASAPAKVSTPAPEKAPEVAEPPAAKAPEAPSPAPVPPKPAAPVPAKAQ